MEKERNRRKGKGNTGQSRALPSVWDSSHITWQAAAGAAWGATQWRGAEGADVTRERAFSVAEVTQYGFAGLSLHTSKYIDGPACPPIILIVFICTILFFLLAINLSFLVWYWYDKKSTAARLLTLRDRQCDSAPIEGDAPVEVLITFPPEVWISPHEKRYHTSPSCCSLTSTVPIPKGLCNYCHGRDKATAAATEEDSA